jgi:hypothetical protein
MNLQPCFSFASGPPSQRIQGEAETVFRIATGIPLQLTQPATPIRSDRSAGGPRRAGGPPAQLGEWTL